MSRLIQKLNKISEARQYRVLDRAAHIKDSNSDMAKMFNKRGHYRKLAEKCTKSIIRLDAAADRVAQRLTTSLVD